MKGGLRFTFKLKDLSVYAKRIARSASDIKVKVLTYLRPKKPIDISIKAREKAEVQTIKDKIALKVKEGKLTKVEAQKVIVIDLLKRDSFLTKLKSLSNLSISILFSPLIL